MKKIILCPVLLTFNFITANAYADTTSINVSGTITAPACTPYFSSDGNLSWGDIPYNSLSATAYTTLTAKPITLTVTCPTATHFAFYATDPNSTSEMLGTNTSGRRDHGQTNRIFGIGKDPVTGADIGNFVINPVSTTVDGTTNNTNFGYTRSSHSSTSFIPWNNSDVAYSRLEDWTPITSSGSPAKGTNFTWNFNVEPQINESGNLTSTQNIDWAGTAQFYFRYF